ncbi:MAG TPA: SusC/RagA family TonB-linked outer membrane protein [Longimicrobiales bacterium]|nr:SusC/RagA family TonB-linked outer membrane protein [Longimicrobiales bacterium]
MALLLVVGRVTPAAAQGGVVGGRVLDQASLRALSGAQVVVVGTQQGVVTDADGRFLIQGVSGDRVDVQAVMLGYRAATVSARVGQTDLRIVLEQSAVSLDQIVVTGTPGGEQRRAIGNSVATVRAADVVATQPVGSVQELLNGRAPGVTFTQGGGKVGGGGLINIRGVSSISLNTQPLLYIDGVRVDNDVATGPRVQGGSVASRLSDLNPEDIESIEVIKGPAAATLYGTEAANGVIQVITKKGRFGQRPEFSVSIKQGTEWFMDPQGRIPTNYAKDAQGNIISWNGVQQEDERGTPIWTNGTIQTYALSLSGGTEAVRYYVGSTYDANRGITPDDRNRRFSGRANLTIAPSSKFDVETSLGMTKGTNWIGGDYGYGAVWATMFGLPQLANTPYRGFNGAPPDVLRDVYEATQKVNRFTGSMQVSHRPTSWLTHRLRLGLDQTEEDSQALTNFMTPEQAALLGPATAKGALYQDLRTVAYLSGDYSATARASLTSALGSATSFGAQYYRRRTDNTSIDARDFPLPGIITAAGAAQVVGSQDYVNNTTIGFFGQQQFDLNNRLFLTGALRVDNNSAFGEDFKWATYPKVSASWTVSEEPFWSLDFLKQFRLRAAYGASGQQPVAFAALQTYQPTTGPAGRPIATPQFPGNPALKPERGEEIEAGFDAQLFDRLNVEVTYFNKKTKDAILQKQTAPSAGFPNAQYVNIGQISNHGIEALANLQVLRGERLAWDVTANIGTTHNKIDDLGGLPPIFLTLPFQAHKEGYPIGGFFTKRVVSATLTPTGATTDVMCDDGNGGVVACAQAPAVYFGTPTPTYTGSVTNTFTIARRLRLSALVDFRGGNKLFDTDNWVRCSAFGLCDVNMHPENYDPRQVATVQRAGGLTYVDAYVHDASFAKLREVSASYSIPDAWSSRFGAHGATFSVAARNLHTWTDYPGLDPERRAAISGTNFSAFDQAITPLPAEFVATLRVNF